METKALTVEIKNEEEGVVRARFATLDTVDLDGDLTEPGAFGRQKVKVSSYMHGSWRGALPVGVGEIYEKDGEAIADLQFFLNTQHGRDHFETVKGLGPLGEWSYAFDVEADRDPTEEERALGIVRVLKKLAVHEVSPVLRGAGVNTRTLGVKCEDCAAKSGESGGGGGSEEPENDDAGEPEQGSGADDGDQGPDGDLKELVAAAEGRAAIIEMERTDW